MDAPASLLPPAGELHTPGVTPQIPPISRGIRYRLDLPSPRSTFRPPSGMRAGSTQALIERPWRVAYRG